jgi:hypothetical protein
VVAVLPTGRVSAGKHKKGRVKKCAVDEICKQNFSRIVAKGKKGAEFHIQMVEIKYDSLRNLYKW